MLLLLLSVLKWNEEISPEYSIKITLSYLSLIYVVKSNVNKKKQLYIISLKFTYEMPISVRLCINVL